MAMTIQKAYEAARAIFPGDEGMSVTIEFTLRSHYKGTLQAIRWIHSGCLPNRCVSSYKSWEHALAIAKAMKEDQWEQVEELEQEEVTV